MCEGLFNILIALCFEDPQPLFCKIEPRRELNLAGFRFRLWKIELLWRASCDEHPNERFDSLDQTCSWNLKRIAELNETFDGPFLPYWEYGKFVLPFIYANEGFGFVL